MFRILSKIINKNLDTKKVEVLNFNFSFYSFTFAILLFSFLNNQYANRIAKIDDTGIKILVPKFNVNCNTKHNTNGTGTNFASLTKYL